MHSCLSISAFPYSPRLQANIKQLGELTRLVRGELEPLHRRILAALITIDVHARDIVMDLHKRGTKVRVAVAKAGLRVRSGK